LALVLPPPETLLWFLFLLSSLWVFCLLLVFCELILYILTDLRDSSCCLFKIKNFPFVFLFFLVLCGRNKVIHVNEKNSLKEARLKKIASSNRLLAAVMKGVERMKDCSLGRQREIQGEY
jgi:hypothetical protein